ncbi:hypothetical protein SEA_JUJU_30 [Gordonia phage JuJu]|uniref:Uncharacterized protein n=1 Tax=Gordonia phage JuJu TaxID=2590929 RepID=A0A516KR22_9CAUD|nr:hypothetical protein KNU69_gp30 [Gordonia phage JuJu]QDP44146.1 hypothetical protein SEA_JUJU_30 [Gordonia phage JuJu]
MADTTFTIEEFPGVTFTVLVGSGGLPGLPSNSMRLVASVVNPWYEPEYDYGLDPNGYTELSDRWKRHTQFLEVINMGFLGPAGAPVPTEPPPPVSDPTPIAEEPTDG